METGYIKKHFLSKGYGFIKSLDGRDNIFFNFKDLPDGWAFTTGVGVGFETINTNKGKRATSISFLKNIAD